MINTPRLKLRQWQQSDAQPFAALNSDPEVMRYFVRPLTREESDASIQRFSESIDNKGFGFWAVESKINDDDIAVGDFIGFVGLNSPQHELPFSPCIEIGWRLMRRTWGKGFATEAANACLSYGFEQLQLTQIVSTTTQHNTPSTAVMERIGMQKQAELFAHPAVPNDHLLSLHVWYRLMRKNWLQR